MKNQKEENRVLSKAEQIRKDKFDDIKSRLEAQGYQQFDLTIGLVYANGMAFVLGLPIIALLGVGFLWANETLSVNFHGIGALLFFLVFFLLIVAHELIHGLFWSIFAKKHWKSISFGFIAQYLTPYCTCNEPLRKYEYIIGALMPTVLLGILPAIISTFTGSVPLFLMGAVMIISGGGDLTILLKLLCYKSKSDDTIFIDHPYKAGLIVFSR